MGWPQLRVSRGARRPGRASGSRGNLVDLHHGGAAARSQALRRAERDLPVRRGLARVDANFFSRWWSDISFRARELHGSVRQIHTWCLPTLCWLKSDVEVTTPFTCAGERSSRWETKVTTSSMNPFCSWQRWSSGDTRHLRRVTRQDVGELAFAIGSKSEGPCTGCSCSAVTGANPEWFQSPKTRLWRARYVGGASVCQ